jgi:hypothetical protein
VIIKERPIRFSWGTVINITEFPELLVLFQKKVSGGPNKLTTADIEKQSARLARHDFDGQRVQDLIRSVCKWGGYPGIAGRIINNNQPQRLGDLFRESYKKAHSGMVVEALQTLQKIKMLGGVSFASKHLKFLAPDFAVVLDRIISERMAYPLTPGGYRVFLNDCQTILRRIVSARLEYTGWGDEGWRVSDVEMAIFAKLNYESQ